jgi:predicted AAA+ superfamily ATPase
VHIFTPHGDVPDDTALRLVVLPSETWYAREERRLAFESVLEIISKNGAKPRYRSNRLLFLAPDHGALSRLNDATRVALAWGSRMRCLVSSANATNGCSAQCRMRRPI